MGEVNVPYLVIGAYALFVIGSSLLVGLLPPFVNRPACKETDAARNEINIEQFSDHIRQRRDVETQRTNLNERIANFNKLHPGKIEEVSSRYSQARSRSIKVDGYKICPEIFQPEAGVTYPWYSQRLPDRYVPVHYDVELFVPQWGLAVYDGFMDMEVDIKGPAQNKYILVHAEAEIPLLQFIKDKNNNPIEIDCVAEYTYFKNDYFIIKTKDFLQPENGPISIEFLFIALLPEFDTGIFEFKFGKPGMESTMLASKFEPIEARKGFPCFDEPRFKPTWNFSIDHPKSTIALFNTPAIRDIPIPTINDSVQTTFVKTPPMPSYLIGMVVFNKDDFSKITEYGPGDMPVNIWVRNELIDQGALDILNMSMNIYSGLLDTFRDVDESSIPPKIDMFIIPEYPVEAVPHFGLPIFREHDFLFKYSSSSEKDLQRIALAIAKNLAEFWFGNFVTFSWWDELWLQESLGDYIKYRAVDEAYPEWNILPQFITEELIYALYDDGYPSSHPIYKPISNPYEIEEYFDDIESSKGAAILRMVEEELNYADMVKALTNYLNAHPWGIAEVDKFYESIGKVDKWPAKDFFDRWIRQSNYPLLNIRIADENGKQFIKVTQSRSLNSYSSIFAGDLLYPSPYNFTWYVPLTCSFGIGPKNGDRTSEQDFYIDVKEFSAEIRNTGPEKYTWVHCDRKFAGYYATDYTVENWENLGEALKQKNFEFLPEDRANIIHNLFINGFTERTSYFQVVDVLSYLNRESDYLPWKTVEKHLNDMAGILDYKQPFLQVSSFFSSMMRKIEEDMDLWTPSGVHVEELLKETILSLACRLQDSYCLRKTSELWADAIPGLLSGDYTNKLPPYVREIVFNYHIQNTYNVDEWDLILLEYENIEDQAERRRLLESLTFTRLPWLLARLLKEQKESKLERVDIFDTIRMMSENPVGREIAWDYFRINWREIFEEFGEDDARLGRMLLDISKTFENEFLFFELLEFVFFTETGATANARFRALEIVSTNNIWLMDKEKEIMDAFGDGRKNFELKKNKFLKNRTSQDFIAKAKEFVQNKLLIQDKPETEFSKIIKKAIL